MARFAGSIAALLAFCLIAPLLAQLAIAAVPYLLALLLVVGILYLARPPRRRR